MIGVARTSAPTGRVWRLTVLYGDEVIGVHGGRRSSAGSSDVERPIIVASSVAS
ncbi:hypothetical protein I553_7634 [Mycobacterium xenopi 4042]|uniref:Uncharacterized protein n=1 Tax=Mycobacterium xenopi 4042 TaxID=1299334 RepID=X8ANP9_MYCXE|nr:hypothetical protein I553_7634 [Mycobacterium xenopi 4042]